MATVAAKREKKRKKPTLSFGSSSGASANLPSNMQANLPELVEMLKMQQEARGDESRYEANGSIKGWSAHIHSSSRTEYEPDTRGHGQNRTASICVEVDHALDPLTEADVNGIVSVEVDHALEPQPLTEADVNDIVSHLRRYLQENGPSQEEELLKELQPEQACRVLAEYDTITSFLDRRPGFVQVHEDLHSFVYLDPDDCSSSHTDPPADLYDGLSALSLGAKNAGNQLHDLADSDSGHRSGRTSSSSSISYESSLEGEERKKKGRRRKSDYKDGWTQTPSAPHCQSQGLQAVPPTRTAKTQTQGCDHEKLAELELTVRKRDTEISELRGKLASVQEDHAREMLELHRRIEMLQSGFQEPTLQDEANQLTGGSSSYTLEEAEINEEEEESKYPEGVPTATVEAKEEGGDDWPQECPRAALRQRSPPARAEPKEELHALSIEPRPKQVHLVEEVKVPERAHVPEFHELHWRMEQAVASCSDVESMWSSRGASPTKSKTQQQIEKIVRMVKKQLPNYTEKEISDHVDYVRESQGGFSRMTFNSIVALVLAHIKSNARGQCTT